MYTVICTNQQMALSALLFKRLFWNHLKGIGCLFKGYDKIIYVIGNHVQGICYPYN